MVIPFTQLFAHAEVPGSSGQNLFNFEDQSHVKTRLAALFVLLVALASPSAAVEVKLAADGKARLPVVISESASDRVKASAKTLADYLKRISQAEFPTRTKDADRGIFVGTSLDFPKSGLANHFRPTEITRREEYLLKTDKRGLWLLGATDLAVEHAVWDLLHRLGYRQFFPGEAWEVVPSRSDLSIDVDVFESPDYLSRRIWYGYGAWDYNVEPYHQWCARNRCVPGIKLSTGHAYDGVVKATRTEFESHPEYWPLLNGERQPVANPKPCLSNPDVRMLFVQNVLNKFEQDPSLDSVSMDPSDGGGWCECDACAKLGSVSDQAVTLANEVAKAINKRHPGKLVGMYAYNYHSPPPNVRVHPQVVISVATAFLKGGLQLDEIISGWEERGATLGIREYYGVNVWDRDLPAAARGGNIDYLARTIPEFHAKGATFMSAESSDNWGPNGLGYYLASRMLWDVNQTEHVEELTEDFLSRCFGPAKDAMREFYRQLDASRQHLVFDDQLGRMFRALDTSKQIISSDNSRDLRQRQQIDRRLNDLILYARYVDLFDNYRTAEGEPRQVAFEAMIRHAYRMRRTMMIHAKALYRDVVARDKRVSIQEGATWSVPEGRNPWKSNKPFSTSELSGFLREGIEQRSLVELDFEPVSFSEDLVPAAALKLASVTPGSAQRGRGRRSFYAYVEKVPAKVSLTITGGLIAHYRDRGNIRVELWKLGGLSTTGDRETLTASDRNVPPDGKPRTIALRVAESGLYRIDVSDGGDLTSVEWPRNQRISFKSSMDQPIKTNGRWTLYFYVPRGTTTLGLHAESRGRIHGPSGKVLLNLDATPAGYHSIRVPQGADGRLWEINSAAGSIRLLTVPPYLARSPEELLLPREVVERDR